MQLQRLIEKDIFADAGIDPDAAGSSEILTLNYADRLSCHAVYEVGAPVTDASVSFEGSNNGTDWVPLETATEVTASGSYLYRDDCVNYRYFKVVKAIAAGDFTLQALTLVIGGTA